MACGVLLHARLADHDERRLAAGETLAEGALP